MGTQRIWTEEMDAALRRMIDEQLSGAAIAQAMSRETKLTITRNAVIGRVGRLKLKLNGRVDRAGQHGGWGETKRKHTRKPGRPAKPRLAQKPVLVAPEPEPLPPYEPGADAVLLMQVGLHQCRWPLWPDRSVPPAEEQWLCGGPAADGPWCPTHRAIAVSGRRLAPISEHRSSRPRRGVVAETFL